MKILNYIRRSLWIVQQKIKGSESVLFAYNDVKLSQEDSDYYNKHINGKINRILNHAKETTKFYTAYDPEDLRSFPVIDKNTIVNNYSDFRSSEFVHQKNHIMCTSGSTGQPFRIEQNREKRTRVLAEILYFSNKVGYEVGSSFVALINRETVLKKPFFKQFLQNNWALYTRHYDDESIREIVDSIIKREVHTTLLSYASTLEVLCNYLEKNKLRIDNITGIISGAEALTSKTRKRLHQLFPSAAIVSRYSNQELGVLAQDYDEDVWELNKANYFIEILDINEDKPVPNNTIGRIIVTDLYNRAMPVIRYDTGDLGIFSQDSSGEKILTKIHGRKLDLLYDTSGNPISFFSLDDLFETNYDVKQYQIVQNNLNDIQINVIMKDGKKINELEVVDKIRIIFGNDMAVKINYLNSIPITKSGKFRCVICNYIPRK